MVSLKKLKKLQNASATLFVGTMAAAIGAATDERRAQS